MPRRRQNPLASFAGDFQISTTIVAIRLQVTAVVSRRPRGSSSLVIGAVQGRGIVAETAKTGKKCKRWLFFVKTKRLDISFGHSWLATSSA
jgi:hypothetical protein